MVFWADVLIAHLADYCTYACNFVVCRPVDYEMKDEKPLNSDQPSRNRENTHHHHKSFLTPLLTLYLLHVLGPSCVRSLHLLAPVQLVGVPYTPYVIKASQ